jgi:hypothetical protein
VHRNGVLFFGTAKESDEADSGRQGIGTGVVELTRGNHFERIARQTSASTKNAADQLTRFALEVVA